jgi:hypothetical protein
VFGSVISDPFPPITIPTEVKASKVIIASAITPGSRGQMRLNAIFTEVRGARLAAARIISLLKVDETKPGRGNRSPAARSRI